MVETISSAFRSVSDFLIGIPEVSDALEDNNNPTPGYLYNKIAGWLFCQKLNDKSNSIFLLYRNDL